MAITRVNKLGTVTGGSGLSSLSLTVGATTTAHNRIIVAVLWGASNRTVSCADSVGNNYSQDISTQTIPSGGGWGTVFSARADAVLTNASSTITVTWTGGTVNDAMICAYEYSGLANFTPVDVTVSGTGTSHTSASGSLVTTKANELVFGLTGWSSTSAATLPTYTELDQVHGSGRSIETQEDIVAATGTYNVGATMPGTPNWMALAIGYADTSSASGSPSNTTAPAITGSGMLGMQLTCSQGSWTNQPTSYSYQWTRAGVNITGATGAHYLVASADLTHALGCVVTATNKYAAVTATASNTVTPAVKSVAAGLGI